jgi:hypothetical protein
LTILQEDADAEVVDASVVANDGEVSCAFAADGGDQVFWDAAEAEAAHQDSGAIGKSGNRGVGGRDALVQESSWGELGSVLQDGTNDVKK